MILREIKSKGSNYEISGGSLEELDHLILSYRGTRKSIPNVTLVGEILGENWEIFVIDSSRNWFRPAEHGFFWFASRKLDGVSIEEAPESAYEFLRKHILDKERSEGNWIIIGDETSGIKRPEESTSNLPEGYLFRYIWIIVPPECDIPTTPVGFHAMKEHIDDIVEMVNLLVGRCQKTLEPNKRARIIIFEDRERRASSIKGNPEYTHEFLTHTIPIIMEKVRVQSSEFGSGRNIGVQFIVEQFGPLSGKGDVLPWSSRYIEQRDVGCQNSFKKRPKHPERFVPKDNHPFMGFADAVAYVSQYRPNDDEYREARDRVENVAEYWSFEDARDLANGILMPVNLRNAKQFYQHLRNIPRFGNEFSKISRESRQMTELVDYHSKRLSQDLSVSDFIDFETKPAVDHYRWASDRMIDDRGGIEMWLESIGEEDYRDSFEIHLSGFSQASRRSNVEKMIIHYNELNNLMINHENRLLMERIRTFRRVSEADLHTAFMFEESDKAAIDFPGEVWTLEEVADAALNSNSTNEERHYLGSRLIREALRDGPETSEQVLKMEEDLMNAPIGEPLELSRHRERHITYLLEMLIDCSRGADDKARLEHLKRAKKVLYESDSNASNCDTWRIATVLKLAVSLSQEGMELPSDIETYIDRIPNGFGADGNPNVRCMAWGSRVCDILGDTKKRKTLVAKLRSRAIEAIEGGIEPYRDAMGVTHASHIIDLEKNPWGRGSKGLEIGDEYLKLVLSASYKTTREWVKEKYSEDDPLGQLNFNYR